MWAESTDVIGDFGLLSSDPIQRSIPGPGQMPLLSPDISATILDPPLLVATPSSTHGTGDVILLQPTRDGTI